MVKQGVHASNVVMWGSSFDTFRTTKTQKDLNLIQ